MFYSLSHSEIMRRRAFSRGVASQQGNHPVMLAKLCSLRI